MRVVASDSNARSWLTRTTGRLLAGQEPLQAGQAVEVEVVGRLVQQEHVEAGEQDGGQAGLDPLAARQPGQATSSTAGSRPTSASTRGARVSWSSPPRARKRARASS